MSMIFHHFPGYSMPPEIWKSLITPLFLYLRQNRWYQQILCENIHLPALFKVVFSLRELIFRAIFIFFSEFSRGLSTFYDIISAVSVIETSWNSVKYRISSWRIRWCHLFRRNSRNRGAISNFPRIFDKNAHKMHFDPPYDVIMFKFSRKSFFRHLWVQTKILRYWKAYFGDKKCWTPWTGHDVRDPLMT